MRHSKFTQFLGTTFYIVGIFTCIVFLNFKIPNTTTQSTNTPTQIITSKTVEVVKHKYIDPNLIGLTFITTFSICIVIGALYAYRKTTPTNQQRTLK